MSLISIFYACHFDVNQGFIQPKLDEDVYLCLPKGCGSLSGRNVQLNMSLHGLKYA